MKIVIPGGSGQVGNVLARAFETDGHDVVILSRSLNKSKFRTVLWDAKNQGDWAKELENADVVINLAGRTVNCRYTKANRRQIMDSRVESTHAVGTAISNSEYPPKIWLQSSTATIYAHSLERANDEANGLVGGNEPGFPDTWNFSIDVAKNWEQTACAFDLSRTRLVLMRSAMTMSPDKDGIFDTMLSLVKKGLGGTAASGKQYISWIHDLDFVKAVYFIIANQNLSGAVNISSPHPLPNAEFMRIFRKAWGTRLGLPATKLMLEIGAIFMQTETELILKSRKVVPKKLIDAGFSFSFPNWQDAAEDLCSRSIKST